MMALYQILSYHFIKIIIRLFNMILMYNLLFFTQFNCYILYLFLMELDYTYICVFYLFYFKVNHMFL